MQFLNDSLGERLTTENTQAVTGWNRLTEELLAHGKEAAAALGETLAADPDFAAAHAVKGLMLLGLARAELVPEAHAALGTARLLALRSGASGREAALIDALRCWLEGKPAEAAHVLDTSLAVNRRDIVAFKFSHAIRFMAGDLVGLRNAAHRFAGQFAGTHVHGFALGCLAFAEEEAGDLTRAERLGREAVAMTPRDAWGRHALAHVLEMTGRAREGAAWLSGSTQSWAHCSNFSYHMYWHLALFELELGNFDAVLELYDRTIRASHTDDYRDVANGASLLARLELEGVDVGGRWDELGEIAAQRVDDRRLVFADLHYLLALIGAGRTEDAAQIVCGLQESAAHGRGHDALVAGKVGTALAAGLQAFRAGRHQEAARHLTAALPLARMIGGSHAQRDLFEQLAIESLMRAGDTAQASAMLATRLTRRGGRNQFAMRRWKSIRSGGSRPTERASSLRFAGLAIASTAPAIAH